MDLFDHKIYAAPTRVTAQAVAAMPFDMADEGAPRAKAKKKPKPKTIPRAAPPAPERHDELQLASGQRRPLRHTPLDSDFAGSFLERDDDAAPGPPSVPVSPPSPASVPLFVPHAEHNVMNMPCISQAIIAPLLMPQRPRGSGKSTWARARRWAAYRSQ